MLPVLLAVLVFIVSSARAADAAKKAFDVPAGDAVRTLKQFAAQAGSEIVFSPEVVGAVKTRAVQGQLTPREALDAMLADTGLVAGQEQKTGAFAVRRKAGSEAEKNGPSPAAKRNATADGPAVKMDSFEVTVTVQKRPQAEQDVPISMTSLPARTLEAYRVESMRDLSRLTPNLLVSSFNQSQPTFAIRGATNTFSQIGVNKPVAVVIDDVFMARNTAASFELFDLDSVQVLRGPQGTLFGRNVTGGAIVLATRLPSFSVREAEALVDFGNYGAAKYQGFVSGPVSNAVAAKISFSQHTHDGYGRDRLTGREQDDQDSTSVRGQVRVKLHPSLTALVSADYADDRNAGRTLSSRGLGNDGDRRTSELGYPQSYARTMWGLATRFDWATPVGNLASITAYRESQSAEDYSGVGTSYTFLTAGSQAVTRDLDHPGTLTQELRFASPSGGRGDFVAGLYFVDEDGYRNLLTRALAARTGAIVTNQIADQKVATRSAAAYVDGTWHVTPAVDLTLGARYTTERKEASLIRTDTIVAANNFTARGLGKRWGEFTPRAVIGWAPNRAVRVYGSVTRGFTAGGFNTEAATAALLSRPFDPETVTNYEAGVKTRLWENRVRVNVAVFHQKYADKQELYFNSLTRILTIVNASSATMNGGELEVAVTPVQGLTLTGAYGRLDAKYDEFNVPGVLNYTGNPLGSAPRNKLSFGGDYEWAMGRAGFIKAMAAWSRTDGYYTGASKDPNLFVPSYALANASLGFETASRSWRITAWVKNISDTEFLLTPSTQSVLSEYLGEPRTFGISVGARF
jgi:iron complex outermembrane receptor protein